MQSMLQNIHDHKPMVLVCGSHHAVQLSSASVSGEMDLTSVKVLAPLGAAVHPTIVTDLQKVFAEMLPVS